MYEQSFHTDFPKPLQQWFEIIHENLPHLSRPQARVLAMWSFSLVMTKRIGVSANANFLAHYLDQNEDTLRQRLREWYWEAKQKRGEKRRELDVTVVFPDLLKWVLALWPPERKQLVLAMDATTHKDIFVVLSLHVVYRCCAIPVAWKVLPANQPGSWKPHWQALFGYLKDVVPADWCVIVPADRGLYAPWLFQTIQEIGWHPFLRINTDGKFKVEGEDWQDLNSLLSGPGQQCSAHVTCFKNNPVQATLLARWREGYDDPWYVLTDMNEQEAEIAWYGLRTWIESGYRDLKRDGWQWQSTRITDPQRAERVWLVMSVAMLWVLNEGGQMEDATSHPGVVAPEKNVVKSHPSGRTLIRTISCFLRGLNAILVKLLKGYDISLKRFAPLKWPSTLPP